jgi:alkylation response protein AidB-like acyl-CoA dehydrogenase
VIFALNADPTRFRSGSLAFNVSPEYAQLGRDAIGAAETSPWLRRGFSAEGWRALAQSGIFAQASAGATAARFEGFGRGGADRGLLFAAGAHLFGGVAPVARYGSPAQRSCWEARLRDGTAIAALAVTEAAGGSSFATIALSAEKSANGFRLSGAKTLISNAPVADVFLVLARQFPERGALGLTAFLAPRETPGLAVAALPAQPGLKGAPIGEVVFSDALLPGDSVLGAPGAGLRVFATAMVWERSLLLAGALGSAERDLAACVDALAGREGLIEKQAVSHRLARMKLRLEGARGLLYRAAAALDSGQEDAGAAAMAKVAVSEALVANAEDAMRLMAGAAWRGAAPDFSAALADAFGGLFASGTTEMQLELIARGLRRGEL